ncbi:hypothetical protein ACFO0S_01130 [Chryseomicrobium palamuruense]|uniref:Lipoprotein n=1 Tax=Chryseomicrobium palamuruense TaxID=682973 RepID=A0ABV8UT64_9BACL
MNKWKHLTTSSALILLLSACGTTTSEESEEQVSGSDTNLVEDTDTTETEETNEENTEETEETNEALGERIASDNQPFSLELMEGYELTGEEPNKDVVFFKENDGLFMRIETFAKEGTDRTQLVQTLQDTIQASESGATVMEISSPTKLPNQDMAQGYEMDFENGKVSGYVFETEGHIVRAMIYDSTDTPKTGEFLMMLETLETE